MFRTKQFTTLLAAALFGSVSLIHAQSNAPSLAETRAQLMEKIDDANAELKGLNDEIADAKLPLVRQVNQAESELIDLRDELRRKERVLSTKATDLASLERRVEAFEEQNDYVSGLLNEFVRNFESRIHIAEVQRYEDFTAEAKLALEDANLSATDKMVRQLEVVDLAIARLDEVLGGKSFEGKALSPEGNVSQGTFVLYGPSVYFSAAGSIGLVQRQLNAAEPVVIPLEGDFAEGIRAIASTGSGSIAADPTLGKAVKLMEVKESYFEHIQKGGIVGYAIISLGLLASALALFKLIEINRLSVPNVSSCRELGDATAADDEAGVKVALGKICEPARGMLTTGYENRDQARDIVEERMYETVTVVQPKLERFLPFLAITAAAAPLMGLLGTVIGMIKTFNLITVFGTGDAKSLSSGISEALVTTELGLTIAIPMLVIHGLLSRLAKHKTARLEHASMVFLNKIK